jgi:hypothetical protein
MNKLPIYDFIVGDDSDAGVKCVSLVEDPAMESSFVAFESTPKLRFIALSGDSYEQKVFGAIIIPDKLIYRRDPDIGEYNGKFTKDSVKKAFEKYHYEKQTSNVNLDHNSSDTIAAYMCGDYIVDTELLLQDCTDKGLKDIKLGTWVGTFKIEDKEVFDRVLAGDYTGFSIEAFLDRYIVSMSEQIKNNFKNQIIEDMKKNNKKNAQGFIKVLKDAAFTFFNVDNFERVLVEELGFEVEYTAVGEPVNKVVVNGDAETLEPIGKGEFATEVGILVTDENSTLVEIRPLPEQPVEEAAVSGDTNTEVKAEEAPVKGKEKIAKWTSVGSPVMWVMPDGVEEAASAGDHELEDGRVLVVDETGNLLEVKDVPSDVSGSTETMATETGSTDSDLNRTIAELTKVKAEVDEQVIALKAEIDTLKLQLSTTAGAEPILTDAQSVETITPERYKKMSAYQKSMWDNYQKIV